MAGRATVAALAAALLPVAGAGGAPEQTPKRGGTLVIGMAQEPPCLNPVLPKCFAAGSGVVSLVFQALPGFVEIRPDLTYRGVLVSSATATRGSPFSATYRIDPRARWSDGRPVTSRDFVYTLAMLRRFRPAPKEDPLSTIQQVVPVDSKTVRIIASRPYANWRLGLAGVLPRHVLAGLDFETVWEKAVDDPRTGEPIGSGPFLVRGLERGRQLTLMRNPRYWATPPLLDRIVVRFLHPSRYAEALRTGEVDMIEPVSALGGAAALQLRRQRPRGVRVLSAPGTFWEHISIRMGPGGHPALRDKRVRRALAYGIDRDEIARAAARLHRESRAVVRTLDSVVSLTNSASYRPNWQEYRHRPAEARRLLAEAGCARGVDGIYVCGGERLALRFATTAGTERREQTVRLVQAQLRSVGVEIIPTFLPPGLFFNQALPQGAFDLALFAFGHGTDRYGLFACGNPLSQNFTGYCQRLVTSDLDQARSIIDDVQRARVLNRADARIARDIPVIPLFQNPFQLAVRDHVRGVVPNAAEYMADVENWWLDD